MRYLIEFNRLCILISETRKCLTHIEREMGKIEFWFDYMKISLFLSNQSHVFGIRNVYQVITRTMSNLDSIFKCNSYAQKKEYFIEK